MAIPGADDWADIYADWADGTPAGDNSGAFAISFIEDTFANNPINGSAEPWVPGRTPEVSFFTGGGSKDTLCVQDPCEDGSGGAGGPWLYDTVNDQVPDKNDIVNAFAAAYDDPDDGTIFYFGLDTYSVQGAANAGFWFFRQPVGLEPLNGGTSAGFTGDHSDGDIFVSVAYEQGGKVGLVEVYDWDNTPGPGGKPLGPQLILTSADADCASASADDDVCGVINLTPGEDPAFDYANKGVDTLPADPESYKYESAAFVEFGMNLEAILDQDIGCFSTFLAETRSSPSLTAQLKDFALGSFPVCGNNVTKSGDELSKVGDVVTYTVTIENTGRATLYKESIIDSLVGDLTDGTNAAIVSSDCGASLDPGASCTITYQYTVQAGDLDPLENTVDIVYREFADFTDPNNPVFSGLSFPATSSWEVNLFQPSITFDKTGDTLSKVGDDVSYVITLNNTSSADTPDLECTITDAMLDINKNVTLASGASDVTNTTYAVQPGDLDPLTNTANVSCSPIGFPNVLDASDGHSVDLFQPSITFDKTGDTLSKVGDDVSYTLTLNNTSSADTPDLVCTITDVLLDINKNVTLASGRSDVTNTTYTVQAGDPDPLVNTADVSCSPVGWPNTLTASDGHSVNLFQPAIAADKTGDALSKVGDDVDYTITLSNNSSADTPDLVCSVSDTLLGSFGPYTIVSGGNQVINASYTVQAGDPDPLLNTATVTCSPDGWSNVLTADDGHSTNLFEPSVTIDKTGDALSKIGDDVDYTITVNNTSSADTPDLVCSVSDTLLGSFGPYTIVSGGNQVINASYTVQAGDPDPLLNTATVTCSPTGFPNVLEASDGHSTNLFQPSITLDKSGDPLSKIGDPTDYTITLNNTSSADTPDLTCTVTDTAIGVSEEVVLASGDPAHTINATAAIPAGASDPYVNTAEVTCSVTGFPNVLGKTASHSVNLFDPSITLEKTGDPLSKIGDPTDYVITLTNTSSNDTPALTCTVTDAAIGVDDTVTLAAGDPAHVINATAAIPAGASDPYVNTAEVTCSRDRLPECARQDSFALSEPVRPIHHVGEDRGSLIEDRRPDGLRDYLDQHLIQ